MLDAAVVERLDDRLVRVLERRVLADQRDLHRALALVRAAHELLPLAELGRGRLHAEVIEHQVVRALGAVDERHLVDVVDVARRDHGVLVDRAEQRDLLADVAVEPLLGAAEDRVRLDADAPKLVHRVLGRLRLQLARVADVGHEREVHEHAALRPELRVELADRLEERKRLDVADRAADLGQDEVDRLRLGDDQDALLDLVRDVRDHLDRCAEVVAAALAADHRVVDGAGRHVGRARGVLVGEALVVAQVEVGLGAVLGDEDLAVLERAHRPGIDVDVWIELLEGDPVAARDEKAADGCRGDALPERGDDAAGYEDESGSSGATHSGRRV